MEKESREIVLNLIGAFFLFWGAFAIVNTIFRGDSNGIFWFCYIGLLLMGSAVLLRDSFLVLVQLNIITIPLLVWTLDFFSFWILGHSFLGSADYLFEPGFLTDKIISLQHLVTVPLGFLSLYLIKLKRKDAWKVTFVYLIFLYLVSYFLTPEEENINCVYRSCINFTIPGIPYYFVWLISMVPAVVLTNFVVSRIKAFSR